MKPTLSLGPWDSPDLEMMDAAINPIIVLLIEQYSPMDADLNDCIWTVLELDGIYLKKGTESFFNKFEDICKRIVSGELVKYDVVRIQGSEFKDWLKAGVGDGVVAKEVKIAAQQFLDFLANNPEYWPLR